MKSNNPYHHLLLLISAFLFACKPDSVRSIVNEKEPCDNPIIEKGYYYTVGENEYLWGGEDTATHFNITGWSLDECNLHNGVGRETFKALLKPKFVSVESELEAYEDEERVLILKGVDSVKIYPLNLLREYETINDQIDGVNVIVVYCFVAELTAVYRTSYCGMDLTFAVSGYTYKDPGLDESLESFILWDRETESLWWPITEEAVSGYFMGELLTKYSRNTWKETTWLDIVDNFPEANVLKRNQTMPVPTSWPKVYPCD